MADVNIRRPSRDNADPDRIVGVGRPYGVDDSM